MIFFFILKQIYQSTMKRSLVTITKFDHKFLEIAMTLINIYGCHTTFVILSNFPEQIHNFVKTAASVVTTVIRCFVVASVGINLVNSLPLYPDQVP